MKAGSYYTMDLWEILVPTVRNDGRPIKLRFHHIWDEKVRAITGGLTILGPIKGQWISPNGKLFSERMIPVRIACDKDQIDVIADLTASYYEQEAIMYYKVSEEVVIRHYAKKEEAKTLRNTT